MKYLNLYSDQASAVGQIVNTPNVCVIDGMDKTLFIPKSAGNSVEIIEDDDFINYAASIEFVDLGLPSGTLWMKCNIGAEKETDYGLFFQWGDTVGYDESTAAAHLSESTCPGYGDYTTWNTANLTNNVLNTSVDAAYVRTNGKAKMPTQTQCQELANETNNEWTTIDGVAGRKFTNKSDSSKYIFIPAAGYFRGGTRGGEGTCGGVWSSSLDTSDINNAYDLHFNSKGVFRNGYGYRYGVMGVRGVKNV